MNLFLMIRRARFLSAKRRKLRDCDARIYRALQSLTAMELAIVASKQELRNAEAEHQRACMELAELERPDALRRGVAEAI